MILRLCQHKYDGARYWLATIWISTPWVLNRVVYLWNCLRELNGFLAALNFLIFAETCASGVEIMGFRKLKRGKSLN